MSTKNKATWGEAGSLAGRRIDQGSWLNRKKKKEVKVKIQEKVNYSEFATRAIPQVLLSSS